MRALIQRVTEASVRVEDKTTARIGRGLLVLLGIRTGDNPECARLLAHKVVHLRIFEDSTAKMNLSVREIDGEILVVSQFTLYGETSKGNRPSFSRAAPAQSAKPLYEQFVKFCASEHDKVASGIFQARMEILLINSGPVTLLCEAET